MTTVVINCNNNYTYALNLIMDTNSPPGIIHPFLIENYAWVDECLTLMYCKNNNRDEHNYDEHNYDEHNYDYTETKYSENCDEYQDACLLKEKWAWASKTTSPNKIEDIVINSNKNSNPLDYEYDYCDDDYDECEYDDCDYKITNGYYNEDAFDEYYDDKPDFANFNEQMNEELYQLLNDYQDGYDSESYSYHFGSDGYDLA